jgi:DNA helicase-2/ATP-dependent DNA helicase PcrA
MRTIYQPDNNDAMARIINIPSRRIGDTTIKALLDEADKSSKTLWRLILDHCQGNTPVKTKLTKQTEQGLSSFVNVILTAQKKLADPAEARMSPTELIEYILSKTSFLDFLERMYTEDHEARWANVLELLNQATEFNDLISTGYEDEALPSISGLEQTETSDSLSKFLANIALASEVKTADAEDSKPQVTISTIHAAKGLEWPIVFIPAAYAGSIPHSRAEDTDEERRLLYVAMTRAKALLYLSYPIKNSQREETVLSPFLAEGSLRPYFEKRGPVFRYESVRDIGRVLGRMVPAESDIIRASMGLESKEDNLFPLNGEKKYGDGNAVGENGQHTYTQGQQPPKRRRVDSSFLGGQNQATNTWQPTYTTTMAQSASFTVASTGGFMSAGSHLQILKEKKMNCGADEHPQPTKNEAAKDVKGKSSMARSTKRPSGQGSLMAYLNTVTGTRPEIPIKKVERIKNASPAAPEWKAPEYNPSLPPMGSREFEGRGLETAHAMHRLPSGPALKRPKIQLDEEARTRSSYGFLSSSPAPPESTERLVGAGNDNEAASPGTAGNFAERAHVRDAHRDTGFRAAQTFHTTTMSSLGAQSRRTLGVRRSMDGWAARGGTAWKPPSIRRP